MLCLCNGPPQGPPPHAPGAIHRRPPSTSLPLGANVQGTSRSHRPLPPAPELPIVRKADRWLFSGGGRGGRGGEEGGVEGAEATPARARAPLGPFWIRAVKTVENKRQPGPCPTGHTPNHICCFGGSSRTKIAGPTRRFGGGGWTEGAGRRRPACLRVGGRRGPSLPRPLCPAGHPPNGGRAPHPPGLRHLRGLPNAGPHLSPCARTRASGLFWRRGGGGGADQGLNAGGPGQNGWAQGHHPPPLPKGGGEGVQNGWKSGCRRLAKRLETLRGGGGPQRSAAMTPPQWRRERGGGASSASPAPRTARPVTSSSPRAVRPVLAVLRCVLEGPQPQGVLPRGGPPPTTRGCRRASPSDGDSGITPAPPPPAHVPKRPTPFVSTAAPVARGYSVHRQGPAGHIGGSGRGPADHRHTHRPCHAPRDAPWAGVAQPQPRVAHGRTGAARVPHDVRCPTPTHRWPAPHPPPPHTHTHTHTHTRTRTHTHTHTSCGRTSGDQTRGRTSVKTKASEGRALVTETNSSSH